MRLWKSIQKIHRDFYSFDIELYESSVETYFNARHNNLKQKNPPPPSNKIKLNQSRNNKIKLVKYYDVAILKSPFSCRHFEVVRRQF